MPQVPFGTADDPLYANVALASGATKLQNSGGTIINPATEDTLLDVLAALGGVSGVAQDTYDEQLAVVPAVPTEVVQYTVPAGKYLVVGAVMASSTNRAEFEVLVNGAVIAKKRMSLTEFNTDFSFPQGVKVTAGQVVKLVGTNSGAGNCDMNGTIHARLITI